MHESEDESDEPTVEDNGDPEAEDQQNLPDVPSKAMSLRDAIRAEESGEPVSLPPELLRDMTQIQANITKMFEPYLELQKQLTSGPMFQALQQVSESVVKASPLFDDSVRKAMNDMAASYLPLAELSDAVKQQFNNSGLMQTMSELMEVVGSRSGLAAVAANMRWIDQVTPIDKTVAQFTVTSRIAEEMAGPGALSSWRSALEANSRIDAQLRDATAPSPLFSELARISRAQVDLTDWAVQRAPAGGLLSATSGQSVVKWRDLVSGAVTDPEALPIVVVTGRTNLSLLGSDLLTSPDADRGLVAEGADRVESEVVHPWMAARLEVVAELYAKLDTIDKKCSELLNGAWDDIQRNGPAAAEKVATCTVEAVERALRAAAPDDAVRTWHTKAKRSPNEWESQDRPPHSLRVKYLVRNLGGERKLVESQSAAYGTLVGRLRSQLQATKHASQSDLTALRTVVIAAESLLISLFLGWSATDG